MEVIKQPHKAISNISCTPCRLCVIPFTVLLYGVITIKVHDEVQKKVHLGTQAPDVWPYPGRLRCNQVPKSNLRRLVSKAAVLLLDE
eukprot:scaffold14354_cov20-Tisochrysis_lutea.AAC.1